MPQFEQLNLFTVRVATAYMEATGSPREAFFRIWIEDTDGDISLVKESGAKGKVLGRRSWPYEDLQDAEKVFEQRIKAKRPTQNATRHVYIS